jgi:hypothetical protein
VQLATPGCEIDSIRAVFPDLGPGKLCFGCVGEGIPVVQIDGSGA